MSKIKSLLDEAIISDVTHDKIVVDTPHGSYEFKTKQVLIELGMYAEEPKPPVYKMIKVSANDKEHGKLMYIELMNEELLKEHVVKLESILYNKGKLTVRDKTYTADDLEIEVIADMDKIALIRDQYGFDHDDLGLFEYLRMEDAVEGLTKTRKNYFTETFENAISEDSNFLDKYIK